MDRNPLPHWTRGTQSSDTRLRCMTHQQMHVFAGRFSSREEACVYSEAQWEAEPDESATDEEYAAWEERNPVWGLRDDLRIGLDSDFIETIDGDGRYDYLCEYLVDRSDIETICSKSGDANVLVLFFPDALHDPSASLASTSRLTYCGVYDVRLR